MKCLNSLLLLGICLILQSEAFSNFSTEVRSKVSVANAPQPIKQFEEVFDEHTVEVDGNLFDELGSSSDLQSLLKQLGIEEEANEAPIFKEPQAVRTGIPQLRSKTPSLDFIPGISTRSGIKTKYLSNPVGAHCIPDLKPVNLGLNGKNSFVKYYPTCVRIHQCGGCCPNKELLECQPITSEKIIVKVLELTKLNSINSNLRRRPRRDKVRVNYNSFNVSVENHTECACMCKIKEIDCDIIIQKYHSSTCSCECLNTEEKSKCDTKNTHIWDSESCQCMCRNSNRCSTGEEFDHNSCLCKLRAGLSWRDLHLRKSIDFEEKPFLNKRKPIFVPLVRNF